MLERLNLPEYATRIRQGARERLDIFDPVRRKFVRMTREEWVRQHMLNFLVHDKGYQTGLIAVEAGLKYNRRKKRSDILVYNHFGHPCLIVECKAPDVEITQEVFDQIAVYNFSLKVEYLIVTNGIQHYACKMDHQAGTYEYLKRIPDYQEIRGNTGNKSISNKS